LGTALRRIYCETSKFSCYTALAASWCARSPLTTTEGTQPMQASKIQPEQVYAIKHDDRLVRFYVKAVVTDIRQITPSPAKPDPVT
jgi:hypothetical protein